MTPHARINVALYLSACPVIQSNFSPHLLKLTVSHDVAINICHVIQSNLRPRLLK